MKTLAVVGFVAVVIFVTWLAVQIVSLVPGAFSSLAGLAEDVQSGRQTQNNLEIVVVDSMVNSKEPVAIAWSDMERDGAYVFEYDCTEGVSVDILTTSGEITPIACNTQFMLPQDTFSIDALFSSEKTRFVDVPYTIGFIKNDEVELAFEDSKVLTIINATIPAGIVSGESTTEEPVEETPTPIVDEPVTPVTPPAPITPTYTYVTTYSKPVSNPNGSTDLVTTYSGVGILTSADKFVTKAELRIGDRNAFQFQVKNAGDKTSTDWKFIATLPSGEKFTSKVQEPLKPNEQATLTIGFNDSGDKGLKQFGAIVTGGNDNNNSNNEFTWAVTVTR